MIGSNRLLAATTLCWNFVRAFMVRNRKVKVLFGCSVRLWQSASACCGVAVSCAFLPPDRLSAPPFVPVPFLLRSVLLCVITRLKLSLHYMTRTIQMIDYQKHLYFCSCHNIKIIGFAKTPLDLYLFSKNFLLVIIEALFSQRLFQSPPFWLFRQPLHIFQ